MNQRAKHASYFTIAVGLLVLIAAGYAFKDKALEQWYLWKMESEDEAEREVAAERLGQLRSAKAVRPLIRILREESGKPPPLHYSAKALAEIGFPAVPELIDLLEDKNNDHSDLTAREALIQVGAPAIPLLIDASRHPSNQLRGYAAYVLGKLGRTSEPALIEALKSKSEEAVQHAVEALGNMGSVSEAALKTIIDKLVNGLPLTRSRVIRALQKLGVNHKAHVLPALVRSMEDESALVRRAAVIALGRIGPTPQTVPALIDRLEDSDRRVQVSAAWALGKLGPHARAAVRFLERMLDRCDIDGLVTVTKALMNIGSGEKAIPALIRITTHKDWSTRQYAVRTLGTIGPKTASVIPTLIRLAKDSHPQVRRTVMQALGKAGRAEKAVVPSIIESLEDPNSQVRGEAVVALAGIGPEAAEAIPALMRVLDDKHPGVAAMAADALKKIQVESSRDGQER